MSAETQNNHRPLHPPHLIFLKTTRLRDRGLSEVWKPFPKPISITRYDTVCWSLERGQRVKRCFWSHLPLLLVPQPCWSTAVLHHPQALRGKPARAAGKGLRRWDFQPSCHSSVFPRPASCSWQAQSWFTFHAHIPQAQHLSLRSLLNTAFALLQGSPCPVYYPFFFFFPQTSSAF